VVVATGGGGHWTDGLGVHADCMKPLAKAGPSDIHSVGERVVKKRSSLRVSKCPNAAFYRTEPRLRQYRDRRHNAAALANRNDFSNLPPPCHDADIVVPCGR